MEKHTKIEYIMEEGKNKIILWGYYIYWCPSRRKELFYDILASTIFHSGDKKQHKVIQ